jgi:hypothetical protein
MGLVSKIPKINIFRREDCMREDYSILLSFQIWIVVIALYLCCWDDKDSCEICIVVCNAFIPFIKSLRVQ